MKKVYCLTVDGVFGNFNQGLNLASERVLLARFVENQGLVASFQKFLEEIENDEENLLEENNSISEENDYEN